MARCNLKDDAGSYLSYGVHPHGFHGMSHSKASNFHGCRTLILNHNNLSNDTAKSFGEALSKPNLGLKHLDVSHNLINDAGVELIMESLAYNNSLITLNLCENLLKNASGRAMVEAMKSNKTL